MSVRVCLFVWACMYASCVGFREVLYEDIRSCDTPWLCKDCLKEVEKAVQEFHDSRTRSNC